MDVYAENILDHYRDPRNQGGIDNASVVHEEVNHSCGDALTVEVVIEDGVIAELKWSGTGCAISQAAMSMLSEEVEGMPAEDVMQLSKDNMYDMLGVPIGPRRFKCALLGLHTLKNALHKHCGEGAQTWLKTVELES